MNRLLRAYVRIVGLLLALLVLLSACTSAVRPTVTPVPTPTRELSPTESLEPTPRPVVEPVATASLVHAVTPSPTPEPTSPVEPYQADSLVLEPRLVSGRAPSDLALVNGWLYVCNRATDNVSVIRDGQVQQVIPVGKGPSAIVADPVKGRVFVLGEQDNTITVIDGLIPSAMWVFDEYLACMALVGEQLWIGLGSSGMILVVSANDGLALGRVSLTDAHTISAIVADGASDSVFVATYNRLHRLNAATLSEEAFVGVGASRNLCLSPQGDLLYTDSYNSDRQRTEWLTMDASSLRVLDRLALSAAPSACAVDPQSGWQYLTLPYDHQLLLLSDGQVAFERPIGINPQAIALDLAAQVVYIANADADNVVAVSLDGANLLQTIPLAWRLEDMAWDTQENVLYVTSQSTNQVLSIRDNAIVAVFDQLTPREIGVLPDGQGIVVLSVAEGVVHTSGGEGQAIRTLPLADGASGLSVDAVAEVLYVGGQVYGLSGRLVATLEVPTIYGTSSPPIQVLRDTRRDLLYAVVFNGVPGSNGGYVIRRLGQTGEEQALSTPGRLSVMQLLYDDGMDRFYTTNQRMGSYGIQVADAADGREVLYLQLAGRPIAMALVEATHHLWLAVVPVGATTGSTDATTSLIVLDTRTLGQVAKWTVDGRITAITVAPEWDRVYLADSDAGRILTMQDAFMTAPPAPTPTYTPTPWPTWTATPAPVIRALPTPTCQQAIEESLRPAWNAEGISSVLGCPLEPAQEGAWALQPFERGYMLWRGSDATIFVMSDQGTYSVYGDTWQEGMDNLACEASAPEGRLQPIRGFGRVWCQEPGVRELLGWATDGERALAGIYQSFEGGGLLLDSDGLAHVLLTDARWIALLP